MYSFPCVEAVYLLSVCDRVMDGRDAAETVNDLEVWVCERVRGVKTRGLRGAAGWAVVVAMVDSLDLVWKDQLSSEVECLVFTRKQELVEVSVAENEKRSREKMNGVCCGL